jgi:hypothetical protein
MILAEAHNWWWWGKHLIGIESASGATYLFWSGFVGDLAIIWAVVMWYRHRNCHVKGCPRLGHADPEHGHPTCRIHSPHFDATGRKLMPHIHTDITHAHEDYVERPDAP